MFPTLLKLGVAERNILFLACLLDSLSRPLVRIPLLQPSHVLVQVGVACLAQRYTLAAALERKVDHDVCCGDAGTAEELSFRWGLHEVVFQKVKMQLDLWVHEGTVDFGRDSTGDGLEACPPVSVKADVHDDVQTYQRPHAA